MPLVYAALSPHPPLLVPEVGGDMIGRVKTSADALRKMSEELTDKKIDTLLMISPHSPIFQNQICIFGGKEIKGDLSSFGAGSVRMRFKIDGELADLILAASIKAGFDAIKLDEALAEKHYINRTLDHGLIVPLYYLKESGFNGSVLPLTITFWDYKKLFDFGRMISSVVNKSAKRIALVTSGDLSHRLIQGAPAGYSPRGREFDELIVRLLKEYKVEDILNIDGNLAEEAGECGLRPIAMMLGILSEFKVKPEVFSYEGPFGVGYAVITFDISE